MASSNQDFSVGEHCDDSPSPPAKQSLWNKAYNLLTYTPKWARYDPADPPRFSMSLNVLFGFAGCFTVASLYYSHPILNILAAEFDVSYERASNIPTLAQAGYAVGLLFLCPLGDLFRRRVFVLSLVWFTGTVWIGLCVTRNFNAFLVLTFITAVTTVTPQLMLPLVGDLAPPHRRATALSIVVSGLLLGMLIARVLSGVVTQFVSWRVVYWIAFGLQYIILVLLWFFMPDYPPTNKSLNYFSMLWSIITIFFSNPILVQACLIGFFTSSTFTSYWTTLTFLLAEPPYSLPPLYIGLFALIGVGSMCFGPPYSRLVIDKFVPLFSVILGELICLTGITIGTYIGTFTLAGPVIEAVAIDIGLQTAQIANRSAIYGIRADARNRVNTAYMLSVFCGQLMGTAVGNYIFAEGGWIKSGSANVGFIGGALVICLLRGPWEKGWIGWRGGWGIRRRDLKKQEKKDEENGEVGQLERSAGNGEGSGESSDAEKTLHEKDKEGPEKRHSAPECSQERSSTAESALSGDARPVDETSVKDGKAVERPLEVAVGDTGQ
ncbi:hypothetical protein MMC10_010322 [Thelotrema lepadinum]|nr:hypothetical protein [Thelotrema lepadinum]